MISVVIPYKHHPERLALLEMCLGRLAKTALSPAIDMEICLHEIYEPGSEPALPESDLWEIDTMDAILKTDRFNYASTEYPNSIFHRAFALNRAVRGMAKGEILVLMDGDLLLPKGYFEGMPSDGLPMVGWSKLLMANPEAMELLKEEEDYTLSLNKSKARHPRINGNAGGITIISKNIFIEMKGYPENFRGTWGGEDNAFWMKLSAFGYDFRTYDATICHLFHGQKTPRYEAIHKKRYEMAEWDKEKWQKELDRIGESWGRIEK